MSTVHLHRYWFKFEGEVGYGYGVTAWTEEDALNLLRLRVFAKRPMPRYVVAMDIDVSTLDPGHIRPTWRPHPYAAFGIRWDSANCRRSGRSYFVALAFIQNTDTNSSCGSPRYCLQSSGSTPLVASILAVHPPLNPAGA
jgi:hypothetical protein